VTILFVSDFRLFLLSLVLTCVVLTWLAVASALHRRRLAAVPVRIHVAGSRGKTSTARLIGAALRFAGRRVLVKTTGTDPLLILPDGAEKAWRRCGPPTIAEQARFFRWAAELTVDVVVLESMAIDREYLWASERFYVRATHLVVTNTRPDHLESLGEAPGAVGEAISLLVPERGYLFMSDEAAEEPVLASAAVRGTRTEIVATKGARPLEANQRLALALCRSLGVPDDIAAQGFAQANSDPGAFFVRKCTIAGVPVSFVNAFACNDPVSLRELWAEYRAAGRVVILLNGRRDRPLRTRAFLDNLTEFAPDFDLYLAEVPRAAIWRCKFPAERIRFLKAHSAESALAMLAQATGPDGEIWGIGNYSGIGAKIVAYLLKEERTC